MNDKKDSWIQSWSGKQVHIFNPNLDEICVADIAHALSMLCRFTGQCNRFYSISEHCCHISDYSPEGLKLWGLLHDASEAYIADLNRPTKIYLEDYKQVERNLMSVVAKKYFNEDWFDSPIPFEIPTEIKNLDTAILNNEKEALFNSNILHNWNLPNTKLEGLVIECWSPERAEKEFLDRFMRLY